MKPEQRSQKRTLKAPRRIYFDKASDVPNSRLPVLIFRCVLAPQAAKKALRFRQAFQKSGWTEVLGIAEGSVTLKLGEDGRLFRLKAGDIVVLPAGVGHRRVGSDEGLRVIGAYPPGQSHFNMKRKGRAIPRVPLPPTDPFYGEDGPVVRLWARAGEKSG